MPLSYNPPFAPTYHQRLDCEDFVMETDPGATLRDVIAIEAMKWFIPRHMSPEEIMDVKEELSSYAYELAEAMLNEKAKREKK